MATTSLGRLTLDLAVRLSEFSDGLSRAERETRDRTANMGASVRTFRDQMMEDLGGTQLGGVIDGLNERLASISGGGMMAGAALAGMAVGGIAVATGALITMALETSKADVQLQVMAATANTGLKSFQVLTHAAAGLGVEQEALAAILADTQEKLGEFSATGGGGAADFFEALQNNTKMTDEEIRNLGKTLQGKDGVEAIQILKDKMDELGATSQEQRFMFESLAGDLGNLMPLFANGGIILEEYGIQLENAGVIKSQDAIDQSRILAAETQAIQTKFEGLKTQLVTDMIPALGTLATHFSKGTDKGSDFRKEVTDIGKAVNVTAAMIVGLAAGVGIFSSVMQQFSMQAGNLGQTVEDFYNADGFKAKGAALAAGATRQAAAGLAGYITITNQYREAVSTINTLMDGQKLRLSDLGQTYYDSNTFLQSNTEGLVTNTVEAEANAKAQEKRAAALAKAQKVAGEVKLKPNAKALANAENYGFANYEAQYGLPYGLMTGIHMQESLGNTNATGPKTKHGRAKGGFQLIDATAERFKVANAYNMEQATEGAAKYLSWLYKRFDGDLTKTIAAYNTGEGNVDKNPMSLILSDRWARNKKTGIGQTKEYTKNVLAYMKSATTDTSKLVYDTVTKQAQDAQKLQEDTLRRQGSIIDFYATEKEKIVGEHTKRVTDIEAAYADGSADRIKYLAREQERYEKAKNANALSIFDKYMNEEERIHEDHRKAMEFIDKTFIEGDPNRQLYVDRQNAAYQKDLDNFRFANDAKKREQDKMYQSIANSAKANGASAFGNGLDSMAQRTMSDDGYAAWRVGQDYRENSKSVNDQYTNRQSEINDTDERGDFKLPALERFELLELAKQEHLDNMWAMEQDYALKQQTLDNQLAEKKVAIQEMAFSSMTSAASMFFGENSKMHKAAFIMEKTYAVQKALMNVEETYSNTFNAISAIPLIGPYLAMPMAVAASAMQIASAAGIQGMAVPAVSGIAHGGLDYVPKESTYLLDKGERVLSPRQNIDFTNFMSKGNGNQSAAPVVNMTIENNAGVPVSRRVDDDGRIRVIVGEELNKQLPQHVNNEYSPFNKALKNNYYLQRKL